MPEVDGVQIRRDLEFVDPERRQRVEQAGGQRSDAHSERQDPPGEPDAARRQDEQPEHVAGQDQHQQQQRHAGDHSPGRALGLRDDVL